MSENLTSAAEPTEHTRDRRMLAALAGGVLAVGALGYFVALPALTHRSTTQASAFPVAHARHHRLLALTVPKTKAVAPAALTLSAATFTGDTGNDPFKPLYVPPPPPVVSVAPAPAAGSPASAPAASGSGGTFVPPPAPTYTIKLVSLSFDKNGVATAYVTVNSAQATPTEGAVFMRSFRFVRATEGGPATFEFGETTFDLAIGEQRTFS